MFPCHLPATQEKGFAKLTIGKVPVFKTDPRLHRPNRINSDLGDLATQVKSLDKRWQEGVSVSSLNTMQSATLQNRTMLSSERERKCTIETRFLKTEDEPRIVSFNLWKLVRDGSFDA
ncbi:hypothetical protein K4K53_004645 [Colletotrichum sp. SAR 10_77]|nr:hypothetical protein K4K53_004645 [Colletotrichum sp. SAR 10_77]